MLSFLEPRLISLFHRARIKVRVVGFAVLIRGALTTFIVCSRLLWHLRILSSLWIMRSCGLNPILLILLDFYGFMEIGSNLVCLLFSEKNEGFIGIELSPCSLQWPKWSGELNELLVVRTAGLVLPHMTDSWWMAQSNSRAALSNEVSLTSVQV